MDTSFNLKHVPGSFVWIIERENADKNCNKCDTDGNVNITFFDGTQKKWRCPICLGYKKVVKDVYRIRKCKIKRVNIGARINKDGNLTVEEESIQLEGTNVRDNIDPDFEYYIRNIYDIESDAKAAANEINKARGNIDELYEDCPM
jgi:hypothetical protein